MGIKVNRTNAFKNNFDCFLSFILFSEKEKNQYKEKALKIKQNLLVYLKISLCMTPLLPKLIITTLIS